VTGGAGCACEICAPDTVTEADAAARVLDSLTKRQAAVLECADRRHPHSGRGGWSAVTMRALERRGLVTRGERFTWEQYWPLTALGHAVRLEQSRRRLAWAGAT